MLIDGDRNTVQAGDIDNGLLLGFGIGGATDGVRIGTGSDENFVSTTGMIIGQSGDGVSIDGTGNTVNAGDGVDFTAVPGIGPDIPSAGLGIYGGDDGVSIGEGGAVNDNTVTTTGYIMGGAGEGVAIIGDDNDVSTGSCPWWTQSFRHYQCRC